MKTKFLSLIICFVLTGFALEGDAQVNRNLSNLVVPTSINVNLLPNKNNRHDLGAINKSWKDIYLSGSVFLNGNRFLTSQTGSGIHNTAIGANAFYSNVNGYNNTAIGEQALYSNTIGFSNTATGYATLYYNNYGSANTAYGDGALFYNTTGFGNTANGYGALYVNTTGWYNTANGYAALFYNNTGIANTALGFDAGENVTTGNYNTFIGFNANCGFIGSLNNSVAIGNNATVRKSNTIRIGNKSIISIGGFVNWSNISDARVKKNIKQNVPGLAFINKLNPVTYNFDFNAAEKIISSIAKDKDGKVMQPSAEELESRKQKEQILYTGFVAQEVEKAAKEIGYDFSGVDAPENSNDLYGLRYADFVVPLVKAVQELSKQNEELKSRLDKLEALLTNQAQAGTSQYTEVTSTASLEQNIPNPSKGNTFINYYLPANTNAALLKISDMNGKLIKTFSLNTKGNGQLRLYTDELEAGVYMYSLYVNGKLIQTRKMTIAR